jgi:hypothetical protein
MEIQFITGTYQFLRVPSGIALLLESANFSP